MLGEVYFGIQVCKAACRSARNTEPVWMDEAHSFLNFNSKKHLTRISVSSHFVILQSGNK